MALYCNSCGARNSGKTKNCSNCGDILLAGAIMSNGALPPGSVVGNRYEIVSLIKAGGMGAVYQAKDLRLDRICALKELFSNYEDEEEQEYAIKRFNSEARILSKLQHDHLPVVHDYFIENDYYYLVMSFIEGEDLDTILERDGNPYLPEDKVVEWAKQILNVLDYLHNQETPIIYRDIKPANIMIRKSDGRAMLVDFGIARAVNPEQRVSKTAVGTDGYAPKEQYRGKVEPRSDIYALGATMHHLLTGEMPVPLDFEPVSLFNPNVSLMLDQIIMKALEKEVYNRFMDAKEMLEAMESYKHSEAEETYGSDDIFDLDIEEDDDGEITEDVFDELEIVNESPSGILPPLELDEDDADVLPGLLEWTGEEEPAAQIREKGKDLDITKFDKSALEDFEQDFGKQVVSDVSEKLEIRDGGEEAKREKVEEKPAKRAETVEDYDQETLDEFERDFEKKIQMEMEQEFQELLMEEEQDNLLIEDEVAEDKIAGDEQIPDEVEKEVIEEIQEESQNRTEKDLIEDGHTSIRTEEVRGDKIMPPLEEMKSFSVEFIYNDMEEGSSAKYAITDKTIEILNDKFDSQKLGSLILLKNTTFTKNEMIRNLRTLKFERHEIQTILDSIRKLDVKEDKPEETPEEVSLKPEILSDIIVHAEPEKEHVPDIPEHVVPEIEKAPLLDVNKKAEIEKPEEIVDKKPVVEEDKKKIEKPKETEEISIDRIITIEPKVRKKIEKAPEEKTVVHEKSFASLLKPFGIKLPTSIVHPRDESEMIYIPAGPFIMGSEDPMDNNQINEIYLYAYYIDKHPVTIFRYNMFLQDTGHRKPATWRYSPQTADHPVTGITWLDAKAYADWTGKRLPTEAEWEKAARGADGRIYPWGNEWDKNKCNNWNMDDPDIVEKMLDLAIDRGTTPVGSFPAGAGVLGVMDMAGNVSEWTADWYIPSGKGEQFKEKNYKICKGGSWRDAQEERFRIPYRTEVSYTKCFDALGFRCCQTPRHLKSR